jgi:hypothetical protein
MTKTFKRGITTETQHAPAISKLPRSFLFVPPAERPSFFPEDAASCRLMSLLDPIAADAALFPLTLGLVLGPAFSFLMIMTEKPRLIKANLSN